MSGIEPQAIAWNPRPCLLGHSTRTKNLCLKTEFIVLIQRIYLIYIRVNDVMAQMVMVL